MKKPLFFDDQAHIAEQFTIVEDHTSQLAALAFHKVNAYKLSLQNHAYCMSRAELHNLLKSTLFNYVHPCTVLQMVSYFDDSSDN
ncbi:hypothetical protein [Lacibacter sediminis]|uniref:Uncharacterized protein n=1 Tax=Lacibacter sediminis TaxID=2760713 RepID=A0A7G5XBF5_9BACT|nr:hypothetical protein [Lacibacter sediminis]QNA42808.1 hypothetical protein H4075_11945 [Lacibacter sediminis]